MEWKFTVKLIEIKTETSPQGEYIEGEYIQKTKKELLSWSGAKTTDCGDVVIPTNGEVLKISFKPENRLAIISYELKSIILHASEFGLDLNYTKTKLGIKNVRLDFGLVKSGPRFDSPAERARLSLYPDDNIIKEFFDQCQQMGHWYVVNVGGTFLQKRNPEFPKNHKNMNSEKE